MIALLTKKIQFEKEKSKIKCLWTQLNFIESFVVTQFLTHVLIKLLKNSKITKKKNKKIQKK